MIKFLMVSVIIITLALLGRYVYLDTQYNNSTITDQIKVDVIESWEYITLLLPVDK